MEKLVYILWGIGLAGLAMLGVGFYLIHDALNVSNAFEGIVGCMLAFSGLAGMLAFCKGLG